MACGGEIALPDNVYHKGTFVLARGLLCSVNTNLFGVNTKPYVLPHGLKFELYQGFLVLVVF